MYNLPENVNLRLDFRNIHRCGFLLYGLDISLAKMLYLLKLMVEMQRYNRPSSVNGASESNQSKNILLSTLLMSAVCKHAEIKDLRL